MSRPRHTAPSLAVCLWRWHLLGPVSLERRNRDERLLDTVHATTSPGAGVGLGPRASCPPHLARRCPCGPLSVDTLGPIDVHTTLPDRSLWTKWSHSLRDTVVEQSEVSYDATSNVVQLTAWQRFHDATGNGALNGPSGSQPRGRRTYSSWWQDALGREITAADYGTNGGAILARPSVPPSSSEEVLVTRTRHASTGEPGAVIDAAGTETRWKRDAIGREIETIENFKEGAAPASDVNRTTRFGYHSFARHVGAKGATSCEAT